MSDVELTIEKILDGYPLLYHLGGGRAAVLCEETEHWFEPVEIKGEVYEAEWWWKDGNLYFVANGKQYELVKPTFSFKFDGLTCEADEHITLVGNNKTWTTSNSQP